MGRRKKIFIPLRKPAQGTIDFAEMAACIGEKNAFNMCKYFPGRKVPSPLGVLRVRRDTALLKDWLDGAQIGELTAKYGVNKTTIQNLITKMKQEQIMKGATDGSREEA